MNLINNLLSKSSVIMTLSLLMVIGLNSCEKNQEPVSFNSGNKSARIGPQPNVLDCPSGQHWDYSLNQCIDDNYWDIDPGSISFNSSASSMVAWSGASHSEVLVKITPGTMNGQTYHLCELYDNHNTSAPFAIGESILIKIGSGSTSYYDMYGQRLGVMSHSTTSSGTTFSGFAADFSDPNSAAYNSKYFGNWGRCVGKTLATMAGGTVIGSLTALGCMAFGPECAVTIGLSCAAAATIWNY
ncbi:hypothetical protein [Spirosoma litoris]